jgi:glutathione peroxidase
VEDAALVYDRSISSQTVWRLPMPVSVRGLGLAGAAALLAAAAVDAGGPMPAGSLYSLKTTTLAGRPADLGQYRGKVAVVVNVASRCGFTPQYAGLEKLYEETKDQGVVVLGFPSNDFGGQEPGTAEQIGEFCRKSYGVTFPLFAKVVTKAGPDQSPVYAFLGRGGNLPAWNFSKYVVGRDGQVVAFFPSEVTPESPELRGAIEAALAR